MYLTYIKRIADIIICLIGLPIFALIYICIGILIKIEDGGPIFYKAERIGKDSKIFKMYKFRSMKVNAPKILNEDGSTYNASDDPRVTKIGKFIRETSLDETAQIINVLKGEMSIIGPRASLSGAIGTY
ncbi:MAG: sugar transferase, partial [Peptostreptococcaceae bacterium]|nr:sugar transferase [Peptostreptococcaceae bacterium]